MLIPSATEYQELIQAPQIAFIDERLTGGKVEKNRRGSPYSAQGANAITFKFKSRDGVIIAVRCFMQKRYLESGTDLTDRYTAISQFLRANPRPYFAQFEYEVSGIKYKNEWLPLLVMEWVEGAFLTDYVRTHIRDRQRLAALGEQFRQIVTDLGRIGCAHGDLQHGNILVDAAGTIRLVDYDGMYVPELDGKPAIERGERNYQSPHRTTADFHPMLDRFPAITIYLALVALATAPRLLPLSSDDKMDQLLLREKDLKAPESSKLLRCMSDLGLDRPVEMLTHLCSLEDTHTIPDLDTFIAETRLSFPTTRRREAPPTACESVMVDEVRLPSEVTTQPPSKSEPITQAPPVSKPAPEPVGAKATNDVFAPLGTLDEVATQPRPVSVPPPTTTTQPAPPASRPVTQPPPAYDTYAPKPARAVKRRGAGRNRVIAVTVTLFVVLTAVVFLTPGAIVAPGTPFAPTATVFQATTTAVAHISFPQTSARSGPGTSFEAIRTVRVNQEFPVIAQTGSGWNIWFLVDLGNSQTGWLWSRVVTIIPEDAVIEALNATVEVTEEVTEAVIYVPPTADFGSDATHTAIANATIDTFATEVAATWIAQTRTPLPTMDRIDCRVTPLEQGVNIRRGAGMNFSVVGVLQPNEEAVIVNVVYGDNNVIWWQTSSGTYVRADTVREIGECYRLNSTASSVQPSPFPTSEPTSGIDQLDYGNSINGRRASDAGESYVFYGYANEIVTITMTSSDFDPYLYLYAPDGSLVANDDDGAGYPNARISSMRLPREGLYTIQATAYSGALSGRGNYELTLEQGEAAPVAFNLINVPGGASGTLDGNGGDTWSFYGYQGQVLTLDLFSADFDTFIEVYDPFGSLVDSDDDGGEGLNSRLILTLLVDGTYTLTARGYQPTASGSYTISIRLG